MTTGAACSGYAFCFEPRDVLMVGRESGGVPEPVRERVDASIRIPMRPGMRSLNVAVAASMMIGEALRRTGEWETMA